MNSQKLPAAYGVLSISLLAMLFGLQRPIWCACGGWEPCAWNIWSQHNSQHWVDPYSVTHAIHGMIFCGAFWLLRDKFSAQWRFFFATVAEACWELLENSPSIIERYRTATSALGYTGDSIANSFGDLLSCACGYWIASQLGLWRTIALIVFCELFLLWSIRDGLTLNVLMLVAPIDSIRNWQLGGAPQP